jgi:hypothetical protein
VEGSCEHGNEPLDSIKCWEVLEQLHNWRLFKKDSAPWGAAPSSSKKMSAGYDTQFEPHRFACMEQMVAGTRSVRNGALGI